MDHVWQHARSDGTIASVARLEALANVAAQGGQEADGEHADEELINGPGCRIGYSSVLVVKNRTEATELLAHIFTTALTRNPLKEIGGMLYYDEKTDAIVQVLEGPATAVRDLFYRVILKDNRHTSVKVLWDIDTETRRFGGFGMRLGSDVEEVLGGEGAADAADGPQELLKLKYVSQLTAASRDEAYADIKSILGSAIVTNPKLKIGGALFLNPRTLHVMQVLEGPSAAVRMLYDKIAEDKRHNSCVVMSEEIVSARTFEQWGMLQGDAKEADWAAVAAGGWVKGHAASRRARRNGRETDGDEPAAEIIAANTATPTQAQMME